MIFGGQTRACFNYHRLSSTIIDSHAPFDRGLTKMSGELPSTEQIFTETSRLVPLTFQSDLDQEEDQRRLIHWHFVLPCVCILCNIQEEQHCNLSCSHKIKIAVGDDLANTNKDTSIVVSIKIIIIIIHTSMHPCETFRKLSVGICSIILSRNLSIDHLIFSLTKSLKKGLQQLPLYRQQVSRKRCREHASSRNFPG